MALATPKQLEGHNMKVRCSFILLFAAAALHLGPSAARSQSKMSLKQAQERLAQLVHERDASLVKEEFETTDII
jgi:hypothetical protein